MLRYRSGPFPSLFLQDVRSILRKLIKCCIVDGGEVEIRQESINMVLRRFEEECISITEVSVKNPLIIQRFMRWEGIRNQSKKP